MEGKWTLTMFGIKMWRSQLKSASVGFRFYSSNPSDSYLSQDHSSINLINWAIINMSYRKNCQKSFSFTHTEIKQVYKSSRWIANYFCPYELIT